MTSAIRPSFRREEKTEQIENNYRLVFRKEKKDKRKQNRKWLRLSFQEREEKKIENGFC